MYANQCLDLSYLCINSLSRSRSGSMTFSHYCPKVHMNKALDWYSTYMCICTLQYNYLNYFLDAAGVCSISLILLHVCTQRHHVLPDTKDFPHLLYLQLNLFTCHAFSVIIRSTGNEWVAVSTEIINVTSFSVT